MLELVEPALGDDQHEHAAATFEGVRDLEVDDVDAETRGQGRDLGDHAFTVGHRHAQLEHGLPGGDPHREVAAGDPSVFQQLEQRVAFTTGDDGAHARQFLEVLVECADDGVAVGQTDIGPDRGVARRDPRHVAEPAGRQP